MILSEFPLGWSVPTRGAHWLQGRVTEGLALRHQGSRKTHGLLQPPAQWQGTILRVMCFWSFFFKYIKLYWKLERKTQRKLETYFWVRWFKTVNVVTSLVVQWLRLHTPNAGGPDSLHPRVYVCTESPFPLFLLSLLHPNSDHYN